MASVRKHGKRWYAIIRTPGGESDRYEQVLPEARTRTEAVILAGRMQAAAYGQSESTTVSSETWGRVAAKVLLERDEMADPRSRRNWIPNLRMFIRRFAQFTGDRPVREVTREHCHAYQVRRKGEIDAKAKLARRQPTYSTLRKEVSFLASIFERAVEDGVATSNPWKSIKRPPESPSRERFLSPSEFERLLAAAPPDRAFRYMVLAMTGARKNEALRIAWSAVDFLDRKIQVPNSKKGGPRMSRASRVVPLAPRLAASLVRRAGLHDEPILPDSWNWSHQIRTDWKKAGLLPVRINDLRHTFATWAACAGADPWRLAYILGHASIETTQRYVTLAALMNLLPPEGFIDFGGKTVESPLYSEPARIIEIAAKGSET